MESLTPLLVESKQIRWGSGGGGEFNGGCGQRFVVRNNGASAVRVSILADMTHRGASPLFGGESGVPASFFLDGKSVSDKTVLDMPCQSVLEVNSAGGGGYGNSDKSVDGP